MILFLHGSDTYRSRQKLKEIQEKFIREVDPQGYNLSVFEGEKTEVGKLFDALNASPFMAEKRMVILEKISDLKISEKEEESLLALLSDLLEKETIFVVWEEKLGKRDLKKKIFQSLLQSKYILPFELWSQQEAAGWMLQQFQEQGVQIASEALQALSLAVGEDLWKASSEITKLTAYAKANELQQLEQEHIKELVAGGSVNDIFALVDAVSQGRMKEAQVRLYDQIQSGSHELEILTMLVRQFRIMQQVKDGLDQGLTPDQIASEYKLHPFVVKKMSGQARSFKQEDIQRAYQLLVDVDKGIKSLGLDPSLLLSKTVAEISG